MDDQQKRRIVVIEGKLANGQRLDAGERRDWHAFQAKALADRLRGEVKAHGIGRALDMLATEFMAAAMINTQKREVLEDRIRKLEALVATGNARPRERRQAPSRRIA